MKSTGYTKILLLFLALILMGNGAAAVSIQGVIVGIVSSVVCDIAGALFAIVSGIAAVIVILAGIKWTASEADPGARKAAKDTLIHAIVGMILVLVAVAVVNMIGLPPLCTTP